MVTGNMWNRPLFHQQVPPKTNIRTDRRITLTVCSIPRTKQVETYQCRPTYPQIIYLEFKFFMRKNNSIFNVEEQSLLICYFLSYWVKVYCHRSSLSHVETIYSLKVFNFFLWISEHDEDYINILLSVWYWTNELQLIRTNHVLFQKSEVFRSFTFSPFFSGL